MKKYNLRFYRNTRKLFLKFGLKEPMWHKVRRITAELEAKGISKQQVVDAANKLRTVINS